MKKNSNTVSIADDEYAAFLQQVRRAIILQLRKESYLTDQQVTKMESRHAGTMEVGTIRQPI